MLTNRFLTGMAVAVALAFSPGLAKADVDLVSFDMGNASWSYDHLTDTLTVTDRVNSTLYTQLLAPGGAELDGVMTLGADFNLTVTLSFVQDGPEDWSATGTFLLFDTNPPPPDPPSGPQATPAILGDLGTYYVDVSAGGYGNLDIKANLSPQTPPSLLVNRGDPWVFTGTGVIDPAHDQDSDVYTITVQNPTAYDTGILWTLKVGGTPYVTEDALFGATADWSVYGGEV